MSAGFVAASVAARFSRLAPVESVAVAGSRRTGRATEHSDLDLYIYSTADLPGPERLAIGRECSANAQPNDFWGPGVEWDDPSGPHVDAIFFTTAFMAEQIDRVMRRHEAQLGHSTSFLHTVRVSEALFDRNGWFPALQAQARAPYPDALAAAIIALNRPVLRDAYSSYHSQIAKAAYRHDLVSLNHRIAALLASVFDLLSALNRQPNPGEKRLLERAEALPLYPPALRELVETLLRAAAEPAGVLAAASALIDAVEALLDQHPM